MKKFKFLPMFLALAMFLTGSGFTAYGIENANDLNYFFEETDNGFVLQYEKTEDNNTIYYDEQVIGNITNTKKYIKTDGQLELLEEFNTIIEKKDNVKKIIS